MTFFDTDKPALIEAVLEYLGVRYRRERRGWQKVRCFGPAHARGDRNPSASVSLSEGRYKCFACEMEGDGFDLMLKAEGLMAPEAMAALGMVPGTKKKEVEDWIL